MIDHHAGARDFGSAAGPAARHAQWREAVRELGASQLYLYQWHLLRLDGGWRRVRFGCPPTDASHWAPREELGGTGTVVLGCFVGGHMRGAVELRSLQPERSQEAWVTLSVENAWQERGIGTALMAEAIGAARERGIAHLYLTCHALNRRVQRIAERFAAKVVFEDCECFADIAVLTAPIAPALHNQAAGTSAAGGGL